MISNCVHLPLLLGLTGVLAGMSVTAAVETPVFWEWGPDWVATDLTGSYHSYVEQPDGRVACFQNRVVESGGVLQSDLVVSFTREPGVFLAWTDPVPLLSWEQINDVHEPDRPGVLAHDRLLTRPFVTRLEDGRYFGLGVVCRGYFPRDGLRWFVGMRGCAESVRMASCLSLQETTASASEGVRWCYQGKLGGPVGRYLDDQQQPFALTSDLGPVLHDPEGPDSPDHERPPRNRFVAFPNHIGAPDGANSAGRTALIYSADGASWFFAMNADGTIRDLTPFHGDAPRAFPFVIRRDPGEWWMWQSDGWYNQRDGDWPRGCRGIYLYHSRDGLDWRLVRRDVDARQFRQPDGRIPALKTLSAWIDTRSGILHGMISVFDVSSGQWRKYHNHAVLK